MALSESSLARLVLRETGLTFGRWRQQLHLIVALRELSAGASVQQVSTELGYGESVTAFITMFKSARQAAGEISQRHRAWRWPGLRSLISAARAAPAERQSQAALTAGARRCVIQRDRILPSFGHRSGTGCSRDMSRAAAAGVSRN